MCERVSVCACVCACVCVLWWTCPQVRVGRCVCASTCVCVRLCEKGYMTMTTRLYVSVMAKKEFNFNTIKPHDTTHTYIQAHSLTHVHTLARNRSQNHRHKLTQWHNRTHTLTHSLTHSHTRTHALLNWAPAVLNRCWKAFFLLEGDKFALATIAPDGTVGDDDALVLATFGFSTFVLVGGLPLPLARAFGGVVCASGEDACIRSLMALYQSSMGLSLVWARSNREFSDPPGDVTACMYQRTCYAKRHLSDQNAACQRANTATKMLLCSKYMLMDIPT